MITVYCLIKIYETRLLLNVDFSSSVFRPSVCCCCLLLMFIVHPGVFIWGNFSRVYLSYGVDDRLLFCIGFKDWVCLFVSGVLLFIRHFMFSFFILAIFERWFMPECVRCLRGLFVCLFVVLIFLVHCLYVYHSYLYVYHEKETQSSCMDVCCVDHCLCVCGFSVEPI